MVEAPVSAASIVRCLHDLKGFGYIKNKLHLFQNEMDILNSLEKVSKSDN